MIKDLMDLDQDYPPLRKVVPHVSGSEANKFFLLGLVKFLKDIALPSKVMNFNAVPSADLNSNKQQASEMVAQVLIRPTLPPLPLPCPGEDLLDSDLKFHQLSIILAPSLSS